MFRSTIVLAVVLASSLAGCDKSRDRGTAATSSSASAPASAASR